MHPILIQFHHFFIGTYGLLVAIGLLVGLFTAERMGRRHGVDSNLIMDLAFIGVLSGIVGGRLAYIAVNFHDFLASPSSLIFTREGFVFGGGIILAMLVCMYYMRLKKANIWLVADVFAPAMPLGHAIGRLGCFCAGCCWGKLSTAPWAVTFPRTIGPNGEILGFSYEQHLYWHSQILNLMSMGIKNNDQIAQQVHPHIPASWMVQPLASANIEAIGRSLPVHPVQLYESGGLFILSALLFWAWKKRKFEGQIFLLYLMGYPILRFCDEFFRGDSERGIYGPFSTSQYLSILGFLVGLVLWWVLSKRPLPTPAPAMTETPSQPKKSSMGRDRAATKTLPQMGADKRRRR